MTSALSFSGAAKVAGVAGWPVAHSLSPALHNAWIAAAGLDAVYVPFAIPPEDAHDAFRAFSKLGIRGLNVTVPHKHAALAAADRVTERAARIGAANLLTIDASGGALVADNTDAGGFLDGLARADADAAGPATILGAGGAARAVLVAVIEEGCKEIRFVNRSRDRAEELADFARSLGARSDAYSWDEAERALAGAGLLVNATSLGMTGGAPLKIKLDALPDDAVVYDLVYTPRETALLQAARERGLKTVEGLDMLIGQARPSFEAFFEAEPTESVDARALLETALAARS